MADHEARNPVSFPHEHPAPRIAHGAGRCSVKLVLAERVRAPREAGGEVAGWGGFLLLLAQGRLEWGGWGSDRVEAEQWCRRGVSLASQ